MENKHNDLIKNSEKKLYVSPNARVKKFSVANIITTSNTGDGMTTQDVYTGNDAEKYDGSKFK